MPIGAGQKKLTFTQELKRGGFGIIYKGHYKESDHKPEKIVAVKEYLPEECAIRCAGTADVVAVTGKEADFDEGLNRFRREAEILAECKHPNIVSFYDIFEAYKTAYIVMEFVDGQELSERLRDKGKLQEAELKDILCPLLDALEVVHQKEFVHRDIKPSNIILRSDDSPVLLDFGSAQPIGENQKDLVTDYYSPPEQYGLGRDQGPWTDIYALGVVCYEALIGPFPDKGDERELNNKDIELYEDEVSDKFLGAIDKALKIKPKERPQSVEDWRKKMMNQASPESEQEGAAEKEMIEQSPPERGQKEAADEVPPTKCLEVPPKPQFKLWTALEAVWRPLIFAFLFIGGTYGVYGVYKHGVYGAAGLNCPRVTRLLLYAGANVNATDGKGWTSLHVASWEGHSEVVRVLLEEEADVDATDDNGRTPLHLAALEGHSEVVRVLLDSKADVDATDDSGWTPLRLAEREDHSETERVLREVKELKIFREKTQQDLKPKPDGSFKGEPHLHIVARLNLLTLTKRLLNEGADANATDDNGRTPLHLAVKENAAAAAEVLLEEEADINATDANDNTLLHLAVVENAVAVAEMLLREGANVDAKNKDDWTPLHLAVRENASAVVKMLLDWKADPNAKTNDGNTPLHLAARENAPAVVEMLLDWKADPNAKDKGDLTPLHYAAGLGYPAVVEMLLDWKVDPNAKDKQGWTPLHHAAMFSYPEVVPVLLERGADVDAKANDGKMPENMTDALSVHKLLILHRLKNRLKR